ncbi:MAG: DNA replication initiation control protein YabA [Aerococcus sp.]|nr:DNA replication initiation control protein YabA [Aerococcus sp.]
MKPNQAKEMSQKIDQMHDQMQTMLSQIETLSAAWSELVIENQDLQTENHYLRERVQTLSEELEQSSKATAAKNNETTGLSPALQNLLNIYEDGYHICNISYGQRRQNEEQCMFCLEILHGDRSTAGMR